MYASARKKWAQKANERMEEKGTKGSLTRIARQHGYKKALPFARHVEASPKGSELRKKYGKKSNYAINLNK